MSLIFYYGLDSFRIKEAMEKKTASFLLQNKDGRIEKFDFEKENCQEEVEHILKRRSFFDEPELVIVYAYLSGKDLQKKAGSLFKFLSEEAQEVKEFGSIKGAALEKWALEKITQAGFKIKLPVLKNLISKTVSQGHLSQEIDKLIAYQSYHNQQEINGSALLIHLQGLALQVDKFGLIDAIGARDVKKAVIFLNQALNNGEDPQAVLGQIIYQFRNLLCVKDLINRGILSGRQDAPVDPESIAKLTGLHPFVARKTSQQARQFEREELKKIYGRLSELDLKSKTGQVDLVPSLFEFLLAIK